MLKLLLKSENSTFQLSNMFVHIESEREVWITNDGKLSVVTECNPSNRLYKNPDMGTIGH